MSDAPPQPAPGSDASQPEDRDLFKAPTIEDVEGEVAQAEAILDGKITPNELVIDLEPGGLNYLIKPEPDLIDDAMRAVERDRLQADLQRLLDDIEEVTKEHSQIAIKAGSRGLANDLNTLRNAGRHIAKRVGTAFDYLRKN